jgi:hypothetical protein
LEACLLVLEVTAAMSLSTEACSAAAWIHSSQSSVAVGRSGDVDGDYGGEFCGLVEKFCVVIEGDDVGSSSVRVCVFNGGVDDFIAIVNGAGV